MVLWLAKVLWSCSQPPPTPPPADGPPTPAPTAATAHTGTMAPCVDVELGSQLPVAFASDSAASSDRQDASCAMPGRPDRVFRVVASEDRDHAIEVRPDGFDAVVWVAADCGGPLLACSDEPGLATERIVLGLGSDESVLVGVEAYEGPLGAFELLVDVVPPERCDNELDDDADGRIDCLDPECFTAERCARVCPDRQAPAGSSITVTGDTVGERDGWDLGCLPYGGTSDVAIAYEPPTDGTYVFDLVGSDFDTVL
ncbi:MAG: hypothetical protein KTR31_10280, partial [Myxococcales bacterium]|nr:hypothetical protein [Myxococcales bacterium]